MQVFRGFHHPGVASACALTIGNFDGVHRGHQAMLALLTNEARHRGVPSCVLTFEPHPRDFFAERAGRLDTAPPRIATLRDKLSELERCGIDQAVVLRFDQALASQPPEAFIRDVLVDGLHARYVLVGDDFRFGLRRAGDYAMLDRAGAAAGFDVARMMSYEVHGTRVSSSAVRAALAAGDMAATADLLGRPYSISGHVLHGRKLGRDLGLPYPEPAVPACAPGGGRDLRRARARAVATGVAGRGESRREADGGRRRPRAARGALPRLAAAAGCGLRRVRARRVAAQAARRAAVCVDGGSAPGHRSRRARRTGLVRALRRSAGR